MAEIGRPWCETRQLRAKDVRDFDVAKIRGVWREVMDTFASREDMEAVYGPEIPDLADEQYWYNSFQHKVSLAHIAVDLDREGEPYVVLRVWMHEKGRGGEYEIEFVRYFRHDLIEVQTLPAYRPHASQLPEQDEQAEPYASELAVEGGCR